jgi:hypothetical protein
MMSVSGNDVYLLWCFPRTGVKEKSSVFHCFVKFAFCSLTRPNSMDNTEKHPWR